MGRSLLLAILTVGLCCVLIPVAANSPNDEIQYRHSYASLLASPEKNLSFYLLVTDAGTGYFVNIGHPKRLLKNGVPSDWEHRAANIDQLDKAWTELSKSKAEKWGPPHHVLAASLGTYDARGSFNGEENLYHLDLIFDKNDMLYLYRVRGIGIREAKWVTLCPDGKQIVGRALAPERNENASIRQSENRQTGTKVILYGNATGRRKRRGYLTIDENGKPAFYPTLTNLERPGELRKLSVNGIPSHWEGSWSAKKVYSFDCVGWTGKEFKTWHIDLRFTQTCCRSFRVIGPGVGISSWIAAREIPDCKPQSPSVLPWSINRRRTEGRSDCAVIPQ